MVMMRVGAGRRGVAANDRRRRRGCSRGHHDQARRCCPSGDVELWITPLVELWRLGDRSGLEREPGGTMDNDRSGATAGKKEGERLAGRGS